MQMVAAQRDEELRSAYRDDIALYQPHMLSMRQGLIAVIVYGGMGIV